jgi:periplasmic divalent cation tolerance protein
MELHPYEVPEIIAIPLVAGSPQYIEWIKAEVAN